MEFTCNNIGASDFKSNLIKLYFMKKGSLPTLPRYQMLSRNLMEINQPTNQPTKQASKQASNQPTNQPTCWFTKTAPAGRLAVELKVVEAQGSTAVNCNALGVTKNMGFTAVFVRDPLLNSPSLAEVCKSELVGVFQKNDCWKKKVMVKKCMSWLFVKREHVKTTFFVVLAIVLLYQTQKRTRTNHPMRPNVTINLLLVWSSQNKHHLMKFGFHLARLATSLILMLFVPWKCWNSNVFFNMFKWTSEGL